MLEPAHVGEIKPELMESVLEISTAPCPNTTEAAEQLSSLRRQVIEIAGAKGMAIGAAGTHPYAMWENQRIVARPRYRDLISALRFVARQELIFGVHVHVGVDDPDKAIHVANGMRVHMPILLALSANSPFWRADSTGLASTRTPIFRAFPRVGIPPTYKSWEDYERRIEFMIEARVIEDYTYLWHDVRPHPNFGTVEVRVMDSQTRIEHTLGLAALVQGLVKELSEHFESGGELSKYPFEMLDENKWLAARHGLEGEVVDLPSSERIQTRALARRVLDRMREHCQDLGSAHELEAVDDLLERGNGAARQVVVYEANHDLHEVMAEIVAASAP
jgi:carboxylate-amine ligase